MEITYSIVIPIYNEEANIKKLVKKLQFVAKELKGDCEIIFINDGSNDNSAEELREVYETYENIVVINLVRNYGQTYALAAGFDKARGSIIISMDGDLQHDPEEIPLFIEKLNEGYDIVSGWRKERKDDFITRRLPSRIANWLIGIISGINIHDFGTTFKAYRREVLSKIQLFGEQHRFIPALAFWLGARITEIPISNVIREKGKSNYGLSRTFKVILDLVLLRFLLKYSTKPLYFFGLPGLIFAFAGSGIGIFLLIRKLIRNIHILTEHGPLMFLAILLIIMGIQFISLGILAEIMSRAYYEIQQKRPYIIRNVLIKENKSH
ncbi:MAG: glycosyl transferase [Candidatus Fischerbacteria bacterium RBG_13_37_8]|uniref:Glycosyl transferase n=1 Tax=Candidatus Fischerbacteria bacterium RBG_13_37_8 TaxID=1817863 RepID=A0A1F5VVT0_9BACT|nr:MAG: glycosyl transferase [Candidatus Fischerbacteria bacterium RBG_13_37_8]